MKKLMAVAVLVLASACGPDPVVPEPVPDPVTKYDPCDVVMVVDATPFMVPFAETMNEALTEWANGTEAAIRVAVVGTEPTTSLDRPVPVMETILNLTEPKEAARTLMERVGTAKTRYVMDAILAVTDTANVQELEYRRGAQKVMVVLAEGPAATRSKTQPVTADEAALVAQANGFVTSVLTDTSKPPTAYETITKAGGGAVYDIRGDKTALVEALTRAVDVCLKPAQ